MEELNRQVHRARRWLGLQRFVGALGWCSFLALLAALILVLVDRFYPTGVEAWVFFAAAAAIGCLLAAVFSYARGRGPIDAAIEIDRRFGLKERVSSTLLLTPEQRQTEIGQALVADAVRSIRAIDVDEQFGLAPGRQIMLPLIPLVAAVLIVWLVSPAVVREDPQAQAAAAGSQVKIAAGSLQRKLIEQRREAQNAGLEEARQLFDRLAEEAEKLAGGDQQSRKEALVKLNDLKRQMENRQQQLGGAEDIRKTLDQLHTGSRGPAEDFMKALADGDLRKAAGELQDLKEKVASGQLSDDEKSELAQQLDEMKRKLQEAADQHERQLQTLQDQIERARQAGDGEQASRLQDQLNQLTERSGDMEQMREMADRLGQCAQSLQDGQLQDSADLLDRLQSDLSDLQQQLDEMQMLGDALSELDQARDQMNCGQCAGAGCQACQGAQPGIGMEPGIGMAPGQGMGERPDEETETGFYDTRVPQKAGKGSATIIGEVEGPNVKGDVLQEIEGQLESARAESADPLTGRQIPRRHQDHTREYFNRFRQGG